MPSPEFEQLLEFVRQQPVVSNRTAPADLRADLEQNLAMLPVDATVARETVDAGGVAAEWLTAPGAARDAALLYLHGGGYVIGSTRTHAALTSRLARASNVRVLALDYRLAPEHPFPAAVDDAVKAYRWLRAQGFAPGRIAVGGDSAGGGLAVATLLALRDAGDPLPAAGVCLSPWLDMEISGESATTKEGEDPIVTRNALEKMAAWYLNGADPRSPLASPLNAKLERLPPLLIQVGTLEVLLDDSTRFAKRAEAAGVKVTLERWEGMIHVWQLIAATVAEGQQATQRIGEYIREHID